jgi:Asp-tRNA(Asn)/Glu-tRNA(Gln) amidotransferase A subunit family amidase
MSRYGFIQLLLCLSLAHVAFSQNDSDSAIINSIIIAETEKTIGLELTGEERDSLLENVNEFLEFYQQMRTIIIDNSVSPSLLFNPLPIGFVVETDQKTIQYSPSPDVTVPEDLSDLAFYSVRELGELIRAGQLTSLQLTRFCLQRLTNNDSLLHCVITLTEDVALEQAARTDAEIATGNYRGPLHGIPYGAKDLLAVKGYRTTWGAMPFRDQVIDEDATVVEKLEEAGAVLVAKLSLGALAWGDVWFEDTTRNPWNLEQGSSGSSAGSASAVSAGLVPFAIGTETWGSIVSPSTRCGTTGLRPTFGRVSRDGAMALSWSMDKIGPICREVEDCAIVFDAIRGPDGSDLTVVDAAFNYTPEIDLSELRIGYLANDFDNDSSWAEYNDEALLTFRDLGTDLIEISLPEMPIEPLQIILLAEAAAAFDDLTRSGQDDLLVRQIKNAWPNVFRSSRFIPAVEYIQANRLRTEAIDQMATLMSEIDVYIAPTFEGDNLLLTNLTGHPCVVLPNGFDEDGSPVSITFIGRLFGEATLLAVARAYQQATDFHKEHPPLFE